MPLDIHIAATEHEASRISPGASLDETLHRQLFDHHLSSQDEFPLLNRMSEFYEDATYSPHEARLLATEVETLAKRVNPTLSDELLAIASAARNAAHLGLSVYAICD